MYIRTARPEDLPEILTVYESARAFMAANQNPDQWGTSHPARSILEEDLRRGQLYVCVTQKAESPSAPEIAAVFALLPGDDPTYAVIENGDWLNDRPYATLHRLAASGTVRGVGSFCLQHCLARCRESGLSMRADTHEKNLPMQRVLEKNGFVRCGIIHVADGTPRLAYHHPKL